MQKIVFEKICNRHPDAQFIVVWKTGLVMAVLLSETIIDSPRQLVILSLLGHSHVLTARN